MLNLNYLRQVLTDTDRFEDSVDGLFALISSIRIEVKPSHGSTREMQLVVSMMDGDAVVLTKSLNHVRIGDEANLHFRDRKPRFPVTLTTDGEA